MYRLLIVDDEKYTVDGLFEMLQEVDHIELDVYRAYSAEEAVGWLERTKIDIVLSDIRMPGMNGLELQRVINAQWPHCKVVFLTGIDDFQYTQTAFREGSVDYVLKTEGDGKVIQALDKAVRSLLEDIRTKQIVRNAAEQMHLALPALQKQFLLNVLTNEHPSLKVRQERFQELHIALSASAPVILILGRVDQWVNEPSASDKALLLYAIQNIAAEFFASLSFVPIILNRVHFFWFIQPKPHMDAAVGLPGDQDWSRCIRFVHGTLDSIQRTCKELLGIPVSLVQSTSRVDWSDIASTYKSMKTSLFIGMGHGREMLLTDNIPQPGSAAHEAVATKRHAGNEPFHLEALHTLLTHKQKPEFFRMLDRFVDSERLSAANYGHYLEAYYSIASLFLSYINQWELSGRIAGDVDIDKLMNIQTHASKEEAIQYLKCTAEALFQHQTNEQAERTHNMIATINQHIMENLGQDLSLTGLSEVVYLNPSYISRLYKQYTGQNISEYISELKLLKAKQLLENSELKIHEIGSRLGFETAGYFTRFFKKHTGLTPQEYRTVHSRKP